MNSLFSIIGTGARISALVTFAMTAGIGAASAATTCSEVYGWANIVSSSPVCTVGDPSYDSNTCSKAEGAQGNVQGTCCPTSATVPATNCISTECGKANNDGWLAQAGVTCQ